MQIVFTEGTETHWSLCAVIAERRYVVDLVFTRRTNATDKLRAIVVGADDDALEVHPYPTPYNADLNPPIRYEYGDIERLEIL